MEALRSNRSKKKTLNVQPGLYVVRYVRAAVESAPPIVELSVEKPNPPGFLIISAPGLPLNRLSRIGEGAVVLASVPGKLHVTVYALSRNGSVEATVELESLNSRGSAMFDGELSKPAMIEKASLPIVNSCPVRMNVLGHVAGRGDVYVGPGEWIAGPDNPARIEGISIDVPDNYGLDLVYGVMPASSRGGSASKRGAKLVTLGSFAGSRGRATPISGLKLQLRGESKATLSIDAQVLFLGGPPVRKCGVDLNFLGPTGREPIVGVAISINEVVRSNTATRLDLSEEESEHVSGGRIRVFRSATPA